MSFAWLLVQLSFLFCGYDANTPAGGICHRTDREVTYVSNELVMSRIASRAQLYCCVINAEFIGWVFLDTKIQTNNKYSLSFEKDIGAQVLSLSNIQESDAGTYFCRVSGKNQEIRDYPIVLNIRAQLTNTNPTHYLEVSKTERIPLHIIGIPFPTIHFYRENSEQALVETYYSRQSVRNGRYEITNEGDILIHTLKQSDTGRYKVRLVQGSSYVSEDQVIEVSAGARPFVAYVPRIAYNFTLDQDEILPARFSGTQLNIYWKFTSDLLGERSQRIIGDTDDHYFVSVDGALTVKRVVLADAGKYIGICKNPWGEVQVQTVVKKIIRAAKILVLNNQVGKVGENVTFNVEVTGDPPPYISWWRNGVKITGLRVNVDNSALRLSFLTRNDAGIYTCVADNGATRLGRSIHVARNVSLYIEGFPVMDTELSTKMIVVTENRRIVDMTCVVNGLPISQIKFVLNNITYFPTSTTAGRKNNDQVFANLKLTIDNPSDAGILFCIATNAYGTSSIKIKVEFLEIPNPPRNIHILKLTPNSVNIGWDMANEQFDTSTIFLAMIWTKNYKFKQSLRLSEFYAVFKQLLKDTTYYFSVRASNLAGWSAPSNTMVFKTPKTGPPTPPLVLNRDIFLPSNSIRLYWTTPMNNGGNDQITYTVKMCIWNTERIILDINCQVFKSIRSNEIVLNGLLAFNLYNFYVTAQNQLGSSEETLFQVFSGPGDIIGSPPPISPELIVLITILVTLLLIILVDVMLCVFLKTGIICFLIHTCFFATVLGPLGYAPLKETSGQKVEYQTSYVPVLEKDEEVIAATPLLVEYQQYQELSSNDVLFQIEDMETDTQVVDMPIPQIRNYKFTIEERRKKNDSDGLDSNTNNSKASTFPTSKIRILKEGATSKDGIETARDRPQKIAIERENSRKDLSKYPTSGIASTNPADVKAVDANDELIEKNAAKKETSKPNRDDEREFEAKFEGNDMLV